MSLPSPPVPRAAPSVAVVVTKVTVVLALVALGIFSAVQHFTGADRRSVVAYCRTWKAEGERLHAKWAAAQRQAERDGDAFGSFSTVMGAPEDLADFFDQLDRVAPDDIEQVVARYRDAWRQTAANLGSKASDPLSFLTAQLMVAAQSAGAEREIDSWTRSHCGASAADQPLPGQG
jgi:hypothetical protein